MRSGGKRSVPVAGGLLGRRTQTRHWLTDTKATTYAAVLREYTRVEFGLR